MKEEQEQENSPPAAWFFWSLPLCRVQHYL